MAEVMSSKTLAGPHYPNSHASEQVFGELCLLGPHALYQFRLGVLEWDVLPLKSQADEKPCGLSLPHGAWKSVKSESRAETSRSTQGRNVEAQIQGRRGSQKAELHAKAAADGGKLGPGLKWQSQGSKMAGIGRLKLLFPFPVPVSSRPSLFFLSFSLLPSFSQALTTGCEICFAWRPKEAEFFLVYWKKMYFYIFWDSISLYIPGQPGAYDIDQAVLHLMEICLPVSKALGLNVWGSLHLPIMPKFFSLLAMD